jgi:hypothetical protein
MSRIYFCLAVAIVPAMAQNPTVYASGLKFPSKIIAIQNGNLLVTETDTTPNSGRVTRVGPGGSVKALIDGLPSGLSAPNNDPDGPNGLAASGRTLYIANGEGDSHVSGPSQGTIVPNPAGPSSPLFASILKVTFSNDIDQLAAGFTLQKQDHFTLLDGTPVTLNNGANDTATVELLTAFRLDIPDPRTIYRNSHPYGLTLLPAQPDSLYVNDAGMNTAVQVSLSSGRSKVLARFANTPSPLPAGPPTIEAVPTSISAYGNVLLVSLLSGAPFVPGVSRIVAVDPATGATGLFIGGLASTIAILYRSKADGTSQWFALEYSLALTAGAPGRLLVYNSPQGQTLVDGLVGPSSMALDPTAGNLYITTRSDGKVLMLNVGQ